MTPAAALEIAGRVRDALPPHIPFTVKMRRGMDDNRQSRDNFFAIFDGAFRLAWRRSPSTAARSGSVTTARATETSSAKVKQHAGPRTVLGSGDLFTAQDCLNMLIRAVNSLGPVRNNLISKGMIGARATGTPPLPCRSLMSSCSASCPARIGRRNSRGA